MARFDDNPALLAAIRDGVREMHRKYAATGRYDGHDLINWLNEHRNKELNEIYGPSKTATIRKMIADQLLGRFLDGLGQAKDRRTVLGQPYLEAMTGLALGHARCRVWRSFDSDTRAGQPRRRQWHRFEEWEELEEQFGEREGDSSRLGLRQRRRAGRRTSRDSPRRDLRGGLRRGGTASRSS